MAYEAKHYKSESRSYNGSYNNKKGNRHTVKIKIADLKRFSKMVGFLTVAVAIQGAIIGPPIVETIKEFKGVPPKPNKEIIVVDNTPLEELERNKNQIQYIIDHNPTLLKNVSTMNYEVEYGDSLGYLAEKTGNTIGRICELNHLNRNDMIYQGQELKLEVLEDKPELDKDIACLESYFEDYLLKSQTAKERVPQILGSGNNQTIDSSSIEGRYVTEMSQYQANMEHDPELSEETKKKHIEKLMEIESDCTRMLNAFGVESITPYSKYKVYLENGTTKYDEVQDHVHSIYG